MLTSHSQKCLPVLERTALNHSGEFFVTYPHIRDLTENNRHFYENVATAYKLAIWAWSIL